jgi:hypothetical protein
MILLDVINLVYTNINVVVTLTSFH